MGCRYRACLGHSRRPKQQGFAAPAKAPSHLGHKLLGSLVCRRALRACRIKDRDVDLLRRVLERGDGQSVVVQAVVDQHHALPVVLVLPVHITALGLDVVRRDLAAIVPAASTCSASRYAGIAGSASLAAPKTAGATSRVTSWPAGQRLCCAMIAWQEQRPQEGAL